MTLSPIPAGTSFIQYPFPGEDEKKLSRGHILLHPDRAGWLHVNGTGLEIAAFLDGGLSIDEAVSRLVSRYGIPPARARRDVSAVAEKLEKSGFIGREEAGTHGRTPSLKSLFIHLTSECNLACPHCYASSGGGRKGEELGKETVAGLIDDLTESGGKSVTVSGGEPLLHPHIEEILDYAAARLSVRLLTNGLLIGERFAAFLAERKIHVQLSLDGSNETIHDAIRGQGSFARTVEAVKKLQQAGLRDHINLCATIMPENRDDLGNVITLAEDLGIPLLRFLPLRKKGRAAGTEPGGDETDYAGFFETVYKRRSEKTPGIDLSCGLSGFLLSLPEDREDDVWCPVGRMLVVDVSGETYPCVLMMEEEFRLGSIHDSPAGEIMKSGKMASLCRALSERKEKIDDCAPCAWRGLCQGGCMGQALDHKSTIWAADDFCSYRKKSYERAFDGILGKEING